ncbi:hypothetical protein SAMN05421538_101273 [Paracoccus isoporae]|uniref:D-galactarate dehydratase n=1 Tax=Paracoccus isoporae TaxID=591205 RepID=A0A1G6TG59_9RHOB|nr:hypothetical protein [Paracoccus isoporae]SDD27999.1 hypothetical protein SAMN05421538_101273 [Paracoccus isoporae]
MTRTTSATALILTAMVLTACGAGGNSAIVSRSEAERRAAAAEATPAPAPAAPSQAAVAAASQSASSVLQGASQSVASLDTTTAEEKAAAAEPSSGGGRLGTTVASLGDATEGGFWLKTPLVTAPGKGRVVNPADGKSANVDLQPLSGGGAGSQISLAAMQTLGVPITDLPELEVWQN